MLFLLGVLVNCVAWLLSSMLGGTTINQQNVYGKQSLPRLGLHILHYFPQFCCGEIESHTVFHLTNQTITLQSTMTMQTLLDTTMPLYRLLLNSNTLQSRMMTIAKLYADTYCYLNVFIADTWSFYLPYLYSWISIIGCSLLLGKSFCLTQSPKSPSCF